MDEWNWSCAAAQNRSAVEDLLLLPQVIYLEEGGREGDGMNLERTENRERRGVKRMKQQVSCH